jgi:hypothetical protein
MIVRLAGTWLRHRLSSFVPVAPIASLAPLTLLAALALCGCASSLDPQDVEGIGESEDEIFRYMDFPGIAADEGFTAVERLVRLRLAGTRLTSDPQTRTLETAPRSFATSPQRITLFAGVSPIDEGCRIELFARVERLRENLKVDPATPWEFVGRDAVLENKLFQELWDLLVANRRIEEALREE